MSEKPADDKQPGVNRLTGRKYNIPTNPGGRPKGSKNRVKTALDKTGKDPVMELIKIAELLNANPPEHQRKALEVASKIWGKLLEYTQAKKKASPKGNEDEAEDPIEGSLKAAKAAHKLLKGLEKESEDVNPPGTGTSNSIGLDSGAVDIQTETGTEEDLQDGQGQ